MKINTNMENAETKVTPHTIFLNVEDEGRSGEEEEEGRRRGGRGEEEEGRRRGGGEDEGGGGRITNIYLLLIFLNKYGLGKKSI